MQTQTQTRKILTLTSEEVEAILLNYLQQEGIMEKNDEVTIENVPDVVSIKLLGKIEVLFPIIPKLEDLAACAEKMDLKDDTACIAVNQTGIPTQSSDILSKSVCAVEGIRSRSIFEDSVEDKLAPVVTRNIFSDSDDDASQLKAKSMTENIWEDG